MIADFLLAIVSYIGLVAGYALGRIAPEERKPYASSLLMVQHTTLWGAFICALVFELLYSHAWLVAAVFALGVITFLIHVNILRIIRPYQIQIMSIALGLLIVLVNGTALLVMSLVSFLFFMTLALQKTNNSFSSLRTLFLQTAGYLAVPLLALF